jgi:hypothetical protein
LNTKAEFIRLASQRTWDKDVVVWCGPEASLMAALPVLPGLTWQTMDLLDLLKEEAIPDSDEEVATLLRRTLGKKLPEIAPTAGQRRILIVKSAGILVRYNLGLREFFDWFCSDRAMVVLLAEQSAEKIGFPVGIEYRARLLPEYFHRPDLAKHLFVAS